MTTKKKIIKRLNEGFGYNLPLDTEIMTHQANGGNKKMNGESFSWYLNDKKHAFGFLLGSYNTITECLKWKRWVINPDPQVEEIFEYIEEYDDFYRQPRQYNYLIENKKQYRKEN